MKLTDREWRDFVIDDIFIPFLAKNSQIDDIRGAKRIMKNGFKD